MLLLAFDTTAAACSVAVVRNGESLARAREPMDQGQAEALVPMIQRVMADAGVSYSDLDRIAVTVGPGSFTGVRVGLATARALGLAAEKPVVGVTSLEVLEHGVANAEREHGVSILAVIDTKRGDVYIQAFTATDHRPNGEPAALAPAEIPAWIEDKELAEKDIILVGDAAALVRKVLPQARLSAADILPNAELLAQLAAVRAIDPAGPLPLYVLPPKVTLSPHGGRLRP